jgi:hypothetical protein
MVPIPPKLPKLLQEPDYGYSSRLLFLPFGCFFSPEPSRNAFYGIAFRLSAQYSGYLHDEVPKDLHSFLSSDWSLYQLTGFRVLSLHRPAV